MICWTTPTDEFVRDPAIAVAAELQHNRLDIFCQHFVMLSSLLLLRSLQKPRPTYLMKSTQATHRHLGMRRPRLLDHLVPFFKWYVANDFFKIVFSKESCPQ